MKKPNVNCLFEMHLPAGIAVLEMENVRRPDGVSPSTRTLYTPSRTPGIVKGKLFLCRLVSSVTGSNFPVVELYFSMLTMYSGPLGLNDGTSMETGPEIQHKGCFVHSVCTRARQQAAMLHTWFRMKGLSMTYVKKRWGEQAKGGGGGGETFSQRIKKKRSCSWQKNTETQFFFNTSNDASPTSYYLPLVLGWLLWLRLVQQWYWHPDLFTKRTMFQNRLVLLLPWVTNTC